MHDTVSAILSESTGPVALLVDFDGTLVEIAASPDAVVVPPDLPERLQSLHSVLDGAFAVVTGRTIDAIDGFLPSQEFAITGGHGAERRILGQRETADPKILEDAAAITSRLTNTLGGEPGILIEPKPTGVAIHYRAAPEKEALARAALTRALGGYNDFHAISGKKVIEARPQWANKGAAIEGLMQVKPFAGRTPVFIGDDVTDEDGFAAADRLGGFGIRIGEGETRARFTLPDIAHLFTYFDALIERERNSSSRTSVNTAQESMVK
ncbi:trehalose-phosphatase [Pelagibacterium sp. 26DY04]|uniref:trehalose-phosphatase n=1 Tax=Pelagibacterium sp. 26DY04 TaxID=2967130 RepID=UPI002814D8A7|nr:trehalose-phosphatase [Pelagibacterium sp. 26DY04]WMT86053.1 trehalose-phosphatase [Pelagibacterium sp. 26DY04]